MPKLPDSTSPPQLFASSRVTAAAFASEASCPGAAKRARRVRCAAVVRCGVDTKYATVNL